MLYNAAPFLKWAGGKTQLLKDIRKALPAEIKKDKFTFIEPFAGSGAVLFWMINNFPNLERAVINDINTDLVNTYKVISSSPKELIEILRDFQREFHQLETDQEGKKEYFYAKRGLFNSKEADKDIQAALFIFLNRTCFNGLYRVNKKNQFNVPMGNYKKPLICNAENIMFVHEALQKVEILNGDFERTLDYAGPNSFFYFDPPYKPLNETSSFNSYAKEEFNDNEQIRLRDLCEKLDSMGHKWMLSNSDVKGANPENNFFDDLYAAYNIKRVSAKRMINSNANKRGELNELLITNYSDEQALQAS